jgi:hypothetical protein
VGSIDDERRVRASEIERRGARRLYLIEEASEHDSTDVRITDADKQLIRELLVGLEAVLSPQVLFHLCCGIEEAVQRRRASA